MTFPIGVHLPYREGLGDLRLNEMAVLAERHGFESVWVSDHTALVENATSRYPFSHDGSFIGPPDEDWYDWVVVLAYLAACTSRIRLGVAVAVLPHRHPLTVAKQVATINRLSGGRISLGVGAGWLAEEFDALGIPFAERGKRTDAALELIRAAWTGAPAAGTYGPFTLPDGVRTHPTPIQDEVPILVGGESPAAIRRAVAAGGWFGTSPGGAMTPDELRSVVARLRSRALETGRDPAEIDVTLRIAAPGRQLDTPTYRERLRDLVDAGATRLTFDVNWSNAERCAGVLETLRDVTAALGKVGTR